MSHTFHRIPAEMRFYRQWIVWRFEEPEGRKPTKVPYSPIFGGRASVTDPNTWATFEEAVTACAEGGWSGIGFVLTKNDPYLFVDLDDVWTPDANGVFPYGDPQTAFDRQTKVKTEFATYAELSPSGKGLHLIGKATLERGRRRGGIEIYSSERFMTMTGDVYGDELPIADCEEIAQVLWHQMGGPADIYDYSTDEPQREDDNTILSRMFEAVNGDKARDLYNGEWSNYYPSASEADFALIDIIAYFTKNRFQITRIFEYSKLMREKYSKRPVLLSNMISRSFDRQLPPIDIEGLLIQLEAVRAAAEASGAAHMANATPEHRRVELDTVTPSQPGGNNSGEAPIARASSIVNPPGLVGEIADFIFAAAPRPVHEIAFVGALGLVAGVAGRTFNVSGTGLNQYLMLIAPTGTGKEAISRGVSKLMTAAAAAPNNVPSAPDYIGPGEIRSDAALLKWIAAKPCILSIAGEFGLRLKQMAAPNASGHEIGLKKVMLDLYNKSGAGEVLNPMAYADKDKNTSAINSPSFTMIGESTGHRFFGALDENMVTEGLLPRFTVIEYDGPRPPLNEHHAWIIPNDGLLEKLKRLIAFCTQAQAAGTVIPVEMTPDAKVRFDQFDKYCDARINANRNAIEAEFWTRAHVKAMKLAATVAVGINFEMPTIDIHCCEWATGLIVAECERMIDRFARGDVGEANPFQGDELQQHRDTCKLIRETLTFKFEEKAIKYGMSEEMWRAGIIPASAITRALCGMASFRKGRMTASAAVRSILKLMVEADELRQLNKGDLAKFNTTAVCYQVSNPNSIFNTKV